MIRTCLITQFLFMLLLNLGVLDVHQGLVVGCHDAEREALLKFKQSLSNPTNGLSSWKGKGCCDWEGVGCHNVTAFVTHLHLPNPYCDSWHGYDDNSGYLTAAKLNPSLLELSQLSYLDLSCSNFQGSQIPKFIGSFKYLRKLWVRLHVCWKRLFLGRMYYMCLVLCLFRRIVLRGKGGRHCGETFDGPDAPDEPSLWTENWNTQFRSFREIASQRSAEDTAYVVDRLFSKNGTYTNYCMYYGGTNFGRTASDFATTGYNDAAAIDHFGLLREPKFRHLKDLHRALTLGKKAMPAGRYNIGVFVLDLEFVYLMFKLDTPSQNLERMAASGTKLMLHDRTTTHFNRTTSMGESRSKEKTQIVIPFQSLLLQITQHLHFPNPKYELLDIQTNNAAVLVTTDSEPGVDTFVGGPSSSLEKSCEQAAQIAVHDLMDRFNVWVEDISISRRREFERCAGLYKLKRQEIRYLSKGLVGVPLIEKLGMGAPIGTVPVIIDYTAILWLILRTCDIESSNLETVSHGRSKYTAWILVTYPKGSCNSKTFYSIRCDSIEDAKNSLAKQVIEFLIPLYNLEIIDANYNPRLTAYAAILCALEMESYIASKERFLKMELATETSGLTLKILPAYRCRKTKDQGAKIPTMISTPVPPKKRALHTSSMLMSIRSKMQDGKRPHFQVPEELSTVLKRAKHN